MNSVQFDNLMLGKDAKWADMEKAEIKKPEVRKPYTNDEKQALRALILKHEEPIPEPTMKDIQDFIAKLRADGHKENKIRRIVKNKYRITVI